MVSCWSLAEVDLKDLNNIMIVHTPAVVANAEPPKIDEGDLAAGVAGVVVGMEEDGQTEEVLI